MTTYLALHTSQIANIKGNCHLFVKKDTSIFVNDVLGIKEPYYKDSNGNVQYMNNHYSSFDAAVIPARLMNKASVRIFVKVLSVEVVHIKESFEGGGVEMLQYQFGLDNYYDNIEVLKIKYEICN